MGARLARQPSGAKALPACTTSDSLPPRTSAPFLMAV